ncbi:MAG: ABC transporter permease [Actinomycetia bacterium]|nr:ABC transporter permease [Actinomycetes bacterium]
MPSDTPHDPARTPGEGPGRRPAAAAGAPPVSRGFKDELLDALSWRALLLVTGVLVLQLGFILSYIGAFHAPKPHRIPVAVVAPARISGPLTAQLNALPGTPFRARTATDERQARTLILNRDVDAAVVVDLVGTRDRLLVASAGGPSVSTVTTQIAQTIEVGRKRQLTVIDLRAPNPQDGRGLSSFYLVVGWMVGGYLAAAILGTAGGARPANLHRTFIRLGALVPYAIISGLGGALIAGTILGALPGHFGALFAIGTLLVFAVAATTVALQALLGMAGIGVAILVFVVLGNPSAGGAYPNTLLPPFWRSIGPWLPPGAGTTAVRNTVYFTGHHTTGPLWTLGVYAAAGILVSIAASVLIARRRRARADRSPSTAR